MVVGGGGRWEIRREFMHCGLFSIKKEIKLLAEWGSRIVAKA